MTFPSIGSMSTGGQAQLDELDKEKEKKILEEAKKGIENEVFSAKKVNMDKLRF